MNVSTTIGFPPFQFVHGVEVVMLVECEIPSLKIAIHVLLDTTEIEEILLHLKNQDEQRRDALTSNEAHKLQVKKSYDKAIKPRVSSKGELVLV